MVSSGWDQQGAGEGRGTSSSPPRASVFSSVQWGALGAAGGRVVELGAGHRRKSHGAGRLAKMSAWTGIHDILITYENGGMGTTG